MRRTASKHSKWQRATVFGVVLVGAAASIAPAATGCNDGDVILNDCPDAGDHDGGDAGAIDPGCVVDAGKGG
jgi:hypothetical protein